ncbi:MAG: hypothetical protein QM718_03295 [Steroidobacteraceae bacterium]
MKPSIHSLANRERQAPAAAGGQPRDPRAEPPRQRLDEVLTALKFDLLTTGIAVDERESGFDPYNSRMGRTPDVWPDVWNGSRRRR